MALSRTLPGKTPKDTPNYGFRQNGEPLEDAVIARSIHVVKEVNRIPFARVELIDGSATEEDFKLSNTDTFKPGQELEIQMGYQGDLETVFSGVIVKHGISIRRDGPSVLVLELRAHAMKMTVRPYGC